MTAFSSCSLHVTAHPTCKEHTTHSQVLAQPLCKMAGRVDRSTDRCTQFPIAGDTGEKALMRTSEITPQIMGRMGLHEIQRRPRFKAGSPVFSA
jgi:hypothetical protein